ncbi:MAG: FkbM family methyltransferase [Streptosporangiales bacterium]|nr:FkbM family methyltransferase [Streptosporangiales bacterium]
MGSTTTKGTRERVAVAMMRAARAANRSGAARRLLRGRSVRRFPLVNRVYHLVFRLGTASGGESVQATYGGLRLSGPAWDSTIMPAVSAGYYEEFEVGVYRRLAASSGLIIDVGANIGVYAVTGGADVPYGGRVVAFEPVPENLTYLRHNVASNELDRRVVVEPVAVGEETGEITLYLSAEQTGKHSAAAANAGPSAGAVTVPMTSVDAYVDGNGLGPPDLIKIDVEGYEGFVLSGARQSLDARPTLLFELHPELQANCGFPAGDLLDLVYARYPWVFLLDELHHTLVPVRRAELDLPGAVGLYRSNLVAIGRDEHLAAVRDWRAAA